MLNPVEPKPKPKLKLKVFPTEPALTRCNGRTCNCKLFISRLYMLVMQGRSAKQDMSMHRSHARFIPPCIIGLALFGMNLLPHYQVS